MTDIRYYIDLVEQSLTEDFNQLDTFDDDRALQAEIARCKRFKSAEEYAHSHYNPIRLTHEDGEGSVPRNLWHKNAERMKARWNHHKQKGLLDDPKASRFGKWR